MRSLTGKHALNWVSSVFVICGWEEYSFPVHSTAWSWKMKRTRYFVLRHGLHDFGQIAQYLSIHSEAADTL